MKWLWKLLDAIYFNLAKFFATIGCFILVVLFCLLSAQFIGERIGFKILNKKHTIISIIEDKNDDLYSRTVEQMIKNDTLRQAGIIVQKTKLTEKITKKGSFHIIVSNNEDIIKEALQNNVLYVLNRSLFSDYSQKYIQYSTYDEYVKATTKYDTDIFIAISKNITSSQQAKILLDCQLFGKLFIKQVDMTR